MRLTLVLIASLGIAAVAQADSVSYTDQGVTFDLSVSDLGGTVNATLDVTPDNTGDYLRNVSIKIFNSFISPSSSSGPSGHTWSVINGARVGSSGAIQSSGSGFIGLDDTDGDNGPPMTNSGSTKYTFTWSWSTTVDPITGWSIKAWTADDDSGNLTHNKSRQWSSGELGGTTPVPEPGTLALLGLGMLGLAAWHRRRSA